MVLEEAGGQEEGIMDRVGAIHVVDRDMAIHMVDRVMVIHVALVEEDKISGISGIGTSSMDTERIIVELDISILQC